MMSWMMLMLCLLLVEVKCKSELPASIPSPTQQFWTPSSRVQATPASDKSAGVATGRGFFGTTASAQQSQNTVQGNNPVDLYLKQRQVGYRNSGFFTGKSTPVFNRAPTAANNVQSQGRYGGFNMPGGGSPAPLAVPAGGQQPAVQAGQYLGQQGTLQAGQYLGQQGTLQAGQYLGQQGTLQAGQYLGQQGTLQAGQYLGQQGTLQAGQYLGQQGTLGQPGALLAGQYLGQHGAVHAGQYLGKHGAVPAGQYLGVKSQPGFLHNPRDSRIYENYKPRDPLKKTGIYMIPTPSTLYYDGVKQ